jgi:hypothetical protein
MAIAGAPLVLDHVALRAAIAGKAADAARIAGYVDAMVPG